MEIAGQGPADRCPGGPLGKLSNYDVYINCAVFPVAGALIAYAYDVAERTVAARKECCRKVETRRAYRAARASEYGA